MSDDTPNGSREAPGPPGGSGKLPPGASPLQARAAFLRGRDWEFVVAFNRGACDRSSTRHGVNPQTYEACRREWESARQGEATLAEVIALLRSFHDRDPFLFLSGHTFVEIARQMVTMLFAHLPTGRCRELATAVAQHVAGSLDYQALVETMDAFFASPSFQAGDRVKTLRGTTHGAILRLLPDGRVAWRPDGTRSQLIALPENLVPEGVRDDS